MAILRREISFASVEPGQTIYSEIFLPTREFKGILQFSPGMNDYGHRYIHFFNYLAERGFIVAYNDHLGHGQTATDDEDRGYFARRDGNRKVVSDFQRLYVILEDTYPGIPHFVMGHSMGSFIVRIFLKKHEADGAILMGTANYSILAGAGVGLANAVSKIKGDHYRSLFLAKLTFSACQKRLKENDHLWAWLSTEKQAQQDIVNNKLRNRNFTALAYADLFRLVQEANWMETIESTPKDLPLLFISGAEDPLGPYSGGILRLHKKFVRQGFQDVSVKIIANARHELCHESKEIQAEVFRYIEAWLNRRCESVKRRKEEI